MKTPAIYIITNRKNGTLYIGVTSNLIQRITQHKEGAIKGFSKKYNLTKLVYFEIYDDMLNAIKREKQIKSSNRANKINLINSTNPNWQDLYSSIL